jgi:hypothetical protein
MKITVRPDFKSLIPALKAEERALQKESIQKEGQRTPIILWVREGAADATVLDGHNRIEILTELGIPEADWKILVLSPAPKSDDEAIAWMLSDQLGRRNLTDDMRKIMAARLYEVKAKVSKSLRASVAARGKQEVLPGQKGLGANSRQQTAEESGLSEKKLRPAIQLLQNNPDLAAKVGSGELSLSKAREQAGLTKPPTKAKPETKPEKSDVKPAPSVLPSSKTEPLNQESPILQELRVLLELKPGDSISDAVIALKQKAAGNKPKSLLDSRPFNMDDHKRTVKQFQDQIAEDDAEISRMTAEIARLKGEIARMTGENNKRDREAAEVSANKENSAHLDMN